MNAHPIAEIFPLLEGAPFDALVADIKEHGQRDPIVLHEGRILDGRNRFRACNAAGVSPRSKEFDGADPVAFVISTNLHRRHLDESQRAMVAARLRQLFAADATSRKHAGTRAPKEAKGRTADKAAAVVNVSGVSVERATSVLERGCPELVRAVDQGVVPVSHAVRLAARPVDEQRAVVASVEAGASRNAIQAERRVDQAKRAALPARADASVTFRLGDARELVAKMKERPHLVVTDPPYGIENHNTRRRGGKDYEDGGVVLLREVLTALVPKLAPDAHLYVFAGYDSVRPFMDAMASLLDVQPNPIIWVKDNHTMCDFSMRYPNKHEYVIFARVRGSRRKLAACVPDVLECARTRVTTHSAEKPVALLERLIEQSSVPGELVVDPFMGGGSTAVAARHLKREFLGFELDKESYDIARSRVD